MIRDRRLDKQYGPPLVRPRPYNPMLELLETQGNTELLREYIPDITRYLAVLEPNSAAVASMIELQPEIQWFMRPFLLDFLIELHSSFRLQPQTLFLCLNIIDRYCSKRIVFKRHYQLVGCTALWIAGKYEDKKSRVPTLKELTMMCRNAYDEDMFIQMEMHILGTLEWSLGHPNLEECLQLAISSCNITPHLTPCKYNPYPKNASILSAVTAVGRFLCELSLYNKNFLNVPTSVVSITANLLACSMLQIPNASMYIQYLMKKRKYDDTPAATNNFNDNETNTNANAYDDNNDFDEDEENKAPEVEGPFLSGFDGVTLNTIRKLGLLFITQLSRTTDVLTKKHEELGVIQVVQNFTARYQNVFKIIHQNESMIEDFPVDSFEESSFYNMADVILQLPNSLSSSSSHESHAPLTPPSASSQFSVFSEGVDSYETPMKSAKYSGYESITETSPISSMPKKWSSPAPSKMHVT